MGMKEFFTPLTCFADNATETTHLSVIAFDDLNKWIKSQSKDAQAWLAPVIKNAKPGMIMRYPAAKGHGFVALYKEENIWDIASALQNLPPDNYAVDEKINTGLWPLLVAAWGMHFYRFNAFKSDADNKAPVLIIPKGKVKELSPVLHYLHAIYLVRDLVNIPASHLGPDELADAAKAVFEPLGAKIIITRGAALEKQYPAVHAVGTGSERSPLFMEINWGSEKHPRISIVGKGVVFDTGGYDIKPSSNMLLMKKDMGGAAHAIGLGYLIATSQMPVQMQILLPIVENSVSGHAMRPSDVIHTRKGLTVEIGNTDAEGRLILADALTRADEGDPEVIIDFATLTGAARVALGPDLPALFCTDDTIAREVSDISMNTYDPVWPLPLWQGYMDQMKGKVADINNTGQDGFAGAIYAALFMQKFVSPERLWMHLDTYAWNNSPRPGRPSGGEALGMRAIYGWLRGKYAR